MTFQVGGSRPAWHEALLAHVELGSVHESTSILHEMMTRRQTEPPDGRFSHLLGRYVGWSNDDAEGGASGVLRLPAERLDVAARDRLEELMEVASRLAEEAENAGRVEPGTS